MLLHGLLQGYLYFFYFYSEDIFESGVVGPQFLIAAVGQLHAPVVLPLYPLEWRLGGPLTGLDAIEKRKTLFPLVFEPRKFCP
jgi:hypothetical protein